MPRGPRLRRGMDHTAGAVGLPSHVAGRATMWASQRHGACFMVLSAPMPSSSAAELHGVRDDVVRQVRTQRWRVLGGIAAAAGAVLLTGAVASIWLSVVGTGECAAAGDEAGAEEVCVRREWWPLTIQQRSEHWTADGVDDGPRIDWHANGQPWLVGAYDHGRRVGPWREYWDNGVMRFSGTYVDDALSGLETWWRRDGTPEWSVERRAGMRSGVERWYWPNGSVRIEGSWFDGEKHGRFVSYDDAGSVTMVSEYLHGAPIR